MKLDNKGFLRVIDANCNRAREGARVLEDVARFIMDDPGISERWKGVRHRITEIAEELESAPFHYRDAVKDPGREFETSGENDRNNLKDIIRANSKRAEEGIRVLEEFSKVFSVQASRKFKELRFQVYSLEKETLSRYDSG